MGPGSWSAKLGGMHRHTDLVARVAHKYLDEREKMRACFRAGVAARGADAAARGVPDGGKSPTKTELKEMFKREREEMVEEQTRHKRTKHALSSDNARANSPREDQGAGDLFDERNAALALLRVQQS